MANKYKLIGFDLDGTLINTLPDLSLTINAMFADYGLPQVPPEKVLTWIGKGGGIFFKNAIAHTGKTFPEAQLAEMRTSFDKYYSTYVSEKSELYPNVKQTLETLKAQGYILVVITNKPTKLVKPVLSAFDIYALFDETLGGQSVPKIKPDPYPILYICEKFNIQPSEMLFVGDSENDVIAAKAAGCEVVGLTYGYNYNIPISESEPDYLCDDFAEVLDIVSAR